MGSPDKQKLSEGYQKIILGENSSSSTLPGDSRGTYPSSWDDLVNGQLGLWRLLLLTFHKLLQLAQTSSVRPLQGDGIILCCSDRDPLNGAFLISKQVKPLNSSSP